MNKKHYLIMNKELKKLFFLLKIYKIFLIFCYNQTIKNKDKKDNVVIKDNNKINISDKIKERHYFIEKVVPNKNIYVEDIQIYGDIKKQKSFFKAKIINNDIDYENLTIFIDFINKKGEVFISELYVIDSIKKGESKVIEVDDIEDFSNAYDVKILY